MSTPQFSSLHNQIFRSLNSFTKYFLRSSRGKFLSQWSPGNRFYCHQEIAQIFFFSKNNLFSEQYFWYQFFALENLTIIHDLSLIESRLPRFLRVNPRKSFSAFSKICEFISSPSFYAIATCQATYRRGCRLLACAIYKATPDKKRYILIGWMLVVVICLFSFSTLNIWERRKDIHYTCNKDI